MKEKLSVFSLPGLEIKPSFSGDFWSVIELDNFKLQFLKLNQDSKLKISLSEKETSISVPLGLFSSTEVFEILQDFVLKKTTQYFPKSFDDLQINTLQYCQLLTVLSCSLNFFNSP